MEKLTYTGISEIVPNPLNPRKDVGDLTDIKQSLVVDGKLNLIQPLIVRKQKGKFELIAGERRWTAIKQAIKAKELPKDCQVPVVVKDMTDDEAVRSMFIENMQRLNLTDYEQAKGFREFLDKYDSDETALADFSEKTGVNIQYIRRKASVMALPQNVLDLWQQGKLLYGHLEQFLRIHDDQLRDFVEDTIKYNWSVAYLKDTVERSKALLKDAIFDKKKAGCNKCRFSTKVQSGLFGDEFKSDEGVKCLSPKCYYEHTAAWLSENWKDIQEVKDNQTNGIVISNDYFASIAIYRETAEKCKTCADYVTQVRTNGQIYNSKACKGNKFCAGQTYNMGGSSQKDMSPEAKQERKTEKLGTETAARFYQEKLPGKIQGIKPDDLRVKRINVYALALAQPEAFQKAMGIVFDMKKPALSIKKSKDALNDIFAKSEKELDKITHDMTEEIIFGSRGFTLDTQKVIAEQFDIRIERDFVMDEAFLNKKTKAELAELNARFNIINKDIQDMKKSDIIPMMLKKDLSGMIPDEIAAFTDPTDDKEAA